MNNKLIMVLLVSMVLMGCQSTATSNFSRENVVSDYALMLALAERPKTADQQMMELFARRAYNYNNNQINLFYLPQGQENPINFISIGYDFSRPLLPASEINPDTLTINLLGPSTRL